MSADACDRAPAEAALADPVTLHARREALAAPHAAPLAGYAATLRRSTSRPVPDVDPADGGVAARLLLLLETPGPAIGRTGFVSRDNPAPTARNLRRFLATAGLARRETLIWNTIPFVIHAPGAGNRPPSRPEREAGLALLPGLLDLLPNLMVVVLAGRAAAAAGPVLATTRPGLPVLHMPHPSPTYVCTSPTVAQRIGATLAQAAAILDAAGGSIAA